EKHSTARCELRITKSLSMDDMFQRVDIPPVPPDMSSELRSRLGSLELNGSHRRFLVNRMGGTGSSWLVKLLNPHPEVFCYHEGVIIRTFPASSYGSEDIISFIRWLALDRSEERRVGNGVRMS